MLRKGPRPTFFVCASLSPDGDLIAETVAGASPNEASEKFSEKYSVKPQTILGPFFKKRAQVLENTRTLKITNEVKKAIYNDWIVNAFILKEPENQAYLVFIKRVDEKKLPTPKGTITVPISELRFIDAQ